MRHSAAVNKSSLDTYFLPAFVVRIGLVRSHIGHFIEDNVHSSRPRLPSLAATENTAVIETTEDHLLDQI